MVAEQAAVSGVLHDHINLAIIALALLTLSSIPVPLRPTLTVERIPQLDNMRMVQPRMYLNFSCNKLQLCGSQTGREIYVIMGNAQYTYSFNGVWFASATMDR